MRLLLDPAVAVAVGGTGGTIVADPPKPAAAAPAPAAEPAKPVAAATPAPIAVPVTQTVSSTVSATAPWSAPAAKPAEAVADPAKPADGVKPTEPEKFDLKLPDGVAMEPAALEGYKALGKDLGLTSKQTQALLDRDLAAQKASQEGVMKQIQAQDATWLGQLRSTWGDKFAERSATVSRAYDYADPTGAFRKKLEAAGLLNNPDLVEVVERFGNLFKEDKIPSGATGVPREKDNRPQQERLADEFRKLNKAGSTKG